MKNRKQVLRILVFTVFTILIFVHTETILALSPNEEYTFKFEVTCGNGTAAVPFKGAEIGLFKHEGDTPLFGGGHLKAVTAYQSISLNESGQGEVNFQFQHNQLLPGDYYWGISYGGNRLTKVEENKFAFYTDHYGFFDRVSYQWATVYAENVYPKQSEYKFNFSTCPEGFQAPVSGTTSPTQPQTGANQPPAIPEFVGLEDGSTLDLEGSYIFTVKPVDGATAYAIRLDQDGKLIYTTSVRSETFSPNYQFRTSAKNSKNKKEFHEGEVKVYLWVEVNKQWSKPRKITINLKSTKVAPAGQAPAAPEFKDLGDGSILVFGGNYNIAIKPVEEATEYKLKLLQNNSDNPDKPAVYEVSAEAETFKNGYTFGANKDSSSTSTKFIPGKIEVYISVKVNGQWSDSRHITITLTANQNDVERIKGAREEIKTNLFKEVCTQDTDKQRKACQAATSACVDKDMTDEDVQDKGNYTQNRKACGERGKAAANNAAPTGSVTLDKVITTDIDEKATPKNTFKPGDGFGLKIWWKNTTGQKADVTVSIKVTDKDGQEIKGAQVNSSEVGDSSYEVGVETEWARRWVRKLPTTIQEETYKVEATLEYKVKGTTANTGKNSQSTTFKVEAGQQGITEQLKKIREGVISDLSNKTCVRYKDQQKKACDDAIAACVNRRISSAKSLLNPEDVDRIYQVCTQEGTEAAKKAASGAQGPSGAKDGQGKTQVSTTTLAYIHGVTEGSFDLDSDKTWISVGSRTLLTTNPSADCVPGSVDLKLTKIKDEKGQTLNKEITISTVPVLVGNVLGNPDSTHRTCWSYQAKLLEGMNKAGVYQLDAFYKDNSSSYKASDDSVQVTFTTDKAKVQTNTKVKVKTGSQASRLLKSLAKVAGVAAQAEGNQVRIVNDPNTSNEIITLLPESSVEGGSCDAQRLPVIRFAVTKILNSGAVETIYDNPQYPNCELWLMQVSSLGDLSQINRIEAVASLLEDSGSEFQGSQGLTVIKIGDSLVTAKPFVKLSSNPTVANIAAGDTVTVVAATNSVVNNPIFEVTHNSQTRSVPANVSNNCQSQGNCEYLLEIPMADGEYIVKFASGEAADTLAFNTKSIIEEDPVSVGLLIGGAEVPLAMNGDMVDLTLDGSPTNTFLLITHFASGRERRQKVVINFASGRERRQKVVINYENLAASPAPVITSVPTASFIPSPAAGLAGYFWYCDGSAIIEADFSGYKKEHTRCSDYGQQCRPINTPGYQSDAECYTPQSASAQICTPDQWEKPICTGRCVNGQGERRARLCNAQGTGYARDFGEYGPECDSFCQTSNEGAAGQPCIYSEADGRCFNGTVKSQSSCGGKTSSTNACINPNGGCEYGGSQVNCATGEAI
ncbi:hypothetical protein HYU93_00235 [Candidatus Daviesbacteria bacterium]|nr:hypothetical protein [Candidatus Daviesbacteria bacterium]